jgi:hypothetical protein
MQSVRERMLKHFPPARHSGGQDEDLANSLYALLWSVEDAGVSVDGWTYFRVVRESEESIKAIGLMTLLPAESIPIEIEINRQVTGLAWSVKLALLEEAWIELSASKRWNAVFLYASDGKAEPQWTWGQQHNGAVVNTDA